MKPYPAALAILLMFMALATKAQLCPGGGGSFSSAIGFNPAWIYGCNTGTSCNGGIAFDNRLACEPTTSMDACAPAPSCGSIPQNASDLWFKFFPGSASALISCFQNTSLVLGIQAFRGGPACGSLTEIGCVLSSGPSSGAQLPLTALTPGVLYYFRVFGSANPVSQRTGLFCFCGSSGLGNYLLLPTFMRDLNGRAAGKNIELTWSASAADNNNQALEIERSSDGSSFEKLAAIPEKQTSGQADYQYEDIAPLMGINYYRLNTFFSDGRFDLF